MLTKEQFMKAFQHVTTLVETDIETRYDTADDPVYGEPVEDIESDEILLNNFLTYVSSLWTVEQVNKEYQDKEVK